MPDGSQPPFKHPSIKKVRRSLIALRRILTAEGRTEEAQEITQTLQTFESYHAERAAAIKAQHPPRPLSSQATAPLVIRQNPGPERTAR